MELFPFQVPVGPLSPPVESLEVRGYVQGIKAGKASPNTATAIARGVTEGIEAYNTNAESDQRQALNQQKIQQNNAILQQQQQQQQALGTLPTQVAKQELQAKRDKLAKDVKLRQQQEKLNQIMQGNDERAKVETVLSGKYNEVFAANPNAYKVAVDIATASKAMTIQEREGFIRGTRTKSWQDTLRKEDRKLQSDYKEEFYKFKNTDGVKDIIAANPDEDIFNIIQDIDWRPSGKFQYDDSGKLIIDPVTKKPRAVENYEASKNFDAISRKTGKLYGTNLPPETQKAISSFMTAASMAGQPGADNPLISRAQKYQDQYEKSQQQQPGQQQSSKPDLNKLDKVNTLPVSTPLTSTRRDLMVVPLVNDQGNINVDSPDAVAIISNGLKIDPNVTKVYQPQIQLTVQKYLDSQQVYDQLIKETLTKEYIEEQSQLTEDLLSADYDKNKEKYKASYNEQAVTEYNNKFKKPEQYLLTMPQTAIGALAIEASKGLYSTIFDEKVSTPKELYIAKNRDRIGSRINTVSRLAYENGIDQLKEEAQRGMDKSKVINTVGAIK